MTMNVKRRRIHQRLAALPGVGSVRRPLTPDGDAEFDLYYVRTGPQAAPPLVVIPGGPGVASVAQYRGLRRSAASAGLQVIMVEHRGVGLSRHQDSGADLPPEALTVNQVVDDVAAVLDQLKIQRAVLYGTSYGTYLTAGMGVRHPGRVQSMILDSPLLAANDIDVVRVAIRHALWQGDQPDTAQLAPKVRELVAGGALTGASAQLAAVLYGLAGAGLLDRQLDLLLRGRRGVWTALSRVTRMLFEQKAPYRNEVDLVERIAFRELNYGGFPDGEPLDPAVAMRELAVNPAEFEAEPYDLVAEMPEFDWPTAVISAGRDLITPPAIAARVASLIPGAVRVHLPTAGHSVLDSRERAGLQIAQAVCAGRINTLPARAAALDRLPPQPSIRLLVALVTLAAAVEARLPSLIHRGRRPASS